MKSILFLNRIVFFVVVVVVVFWGFFAFWSIRITKYLHGTVTHCPGLLRYVIT